MLQGAGELGEDIFFRQVRIAIPKYSGNLKELLSSPRYSTAIGLLLEAKNHTEITKKSYGGFSLKNIFYRFKSWIDGNF